MDQATKQVSGVSSEPQSESQSTSLSVIFESQSTRQGSQFEHQFTPVCPDCMTPMEHVDDDVDLEFNVAFAVYECPSCGRTKRVVK